jgi:hypothetical protein
MGVSRTWLAAEAGWQIAPPPGVRLGLSQRLGRQPRTLCRRLGRRTRLADGHLPVS